MAFTEYSGRDISFAEVIRRKFMGEGVPGINELTLGMLKNAYPEEYAAFFGEKAEPFNFNCPLRRKGDKAAVIRVKALDAELPYPYEVICEGEKDTPILYTASGRYEHSGLDPEKDLEYVPERKD